MGACVADEVGLVENKLPVVVDKRVIPISFPLKVAGKVGPILGELKREAKISELL